MALFLRASTTVFRELGDIAFDDHDDDDSKVIGTDLSSNPLTFGIEPLLKGMFNVLDTFQKGFLNVTEVLTWVTLLNIEKSQDERWELARELMYSNHSLVKEDMKNLPQPENLYYESFSQLSKSHPMITSGFTIVVEAFRRQSAASALPAGVVDALREDRLAVFLRDASGGHADEQLARNAACIFIEQWEAHGCVPVPRILEFQDCLRAMRELTFLAHPVEVVFSPIVRSIVEECFLIAHVAQSELRKLINADGGDEDDYDPSAGDTALRKNNNDGESGEMRNRRKTKRKTALEVEISHVDWSSVKDRAMKARNLDGAIIRVDETGLCIALKFLGFFSPSSTIEQLKRDIRRIETSRLQWLMSRLPAKLEPSSLQHARTPADHLDLCAGEFLAIVSLSGSNMHSIASHLKRVASIMRLPPRGAFPASIIGKSSRLSSDSFTSAMAAMNQRDKLFCSVSSTQQPLRRHFDEYFGSCGSLVSPWTQSRTEIPSVCAYFLIWVLDGFAEIRMFEACFDLVEQYGNPFCFDVNVPLIEVILLIRELGMIERFAEIFDDLHIGYLRVKASHWGATCRMFRVLSERQDDGRALVSSSLCSSLLVGACGMHDMEIVAYHNELGENKISDTGKYVESEVSGVGLGTFGRMCWVMAGHLPRWLHALEDWWEMEVLAEGVSGDSINIVERSLTLEMALGELQRYGLVVGGDKSFQKLDLAEMAVYFNVHMKEVNFDGFVRIAARCERNYSIAVTKGLHACLTSQTPNADKQILELFTECLQVLSVSSNVKSRGGSSKVQKPNWKGLVYAVLNEAKLTPADAFALGLAGVVRRRGTSMQIEPGAAVVEEVLVAGGLVQKLFILFITLRSLDSCSIPFSRWITELFGNVGGLTKDLKEVTDALSKKQSDKEAFSLPFIFSCLSKRSKIFKLILFPDVRQIASSLPSEAAIIFLRLLFNKRLPADTSMYPKCDRYVQKLLVDKLNITDSQEDGPATNSQFVSHSANVPLISFAGAPHSFMALASCELWHLLDVARECLLLDPKDSSISPNVYSSVMPGMTTGTVDTVESYLSCLHQKFGRTDTVANRSMDVQEYLQGCFRIGHPLWFLKMISLLFIRAVDLPSHLLSEGSMLSSIDEDLPKLSYAPPSTINPDFIELYCNKASHSSLQVSVWRTTRIPLTMGDFSSSGIPPASGGLLTPHYSFTPSLQVLLAASVAFCPERLIIGGVENELYGAELFNSNVSSGSNTKTGLKTIKATDANASRLFVDEIRSALITADMTIQAKVAYAKLVRLQKRYMTVIQEEKLKIAKKRSGKGDPEWKNITDNVLKVVHTFDWSSDPFKDPEHPQDGFFLEPNEANTMDPLRSRGGEFLDLKSPQVINESDLIEQRDSLNQNDGGDDQNALLVAEKLLISSASAALLLTPLSMEFLVDLGAILFGVETPFATWRVIIERLRKAEEGTDKLINAAGKQDGSLSVVKTKKSASKDKQTSSGSSEPDPLSILREVEAANLTFDSFFSLATGKTSKSKKKNDSLTSSFPGFICRSLVIFETIKEVPDEHYLSSDALKSLCIAMPIPAMVKAAEIEFDAVIREGTLYIPLKIIHDNEDDNDDDSAPATQKKKIVLNEDGEEIEIDDHTANNKLSIKKPLETMRREPQVSFLSMLTFIRRTGLDTVLGLRGPADLRTTAWLYLSADSAAKDEYFGGSISEFPDFDDLHNKTILDDDLELVLRMFKLPAVRVVKDLKTTLTSVIPRIADLSDFLGSSTISLLKERGYNSSAANRAKSITATTPDCLTAIDISLLAMLFPSSTCGRMLSLVSAFFFHLDNPRTLAFESTFALKGFLCRAGMSARVTDSLLVDSWALRESANPSEENRTFPLGPTIQLLLGSSATNASDVSFFMERTAPSLTWEAISIPKDSPPLLAALQAPYPFYPATLPPPFFAVSNVSVTLPDRPTAVKSAFITISEVKFNILKQAPPSNKPPPPSQYILSCERQDISLSSPSVPYGLSTAELNISVMNGDGSKHLCQITLHLHKACLLLHAMFAAPLPPYLPKAVPTSNHSHPIIPFESFSLASSVSPVAYPHLPPPLPPRTNDATSRNWPTHISLKIKAVAGAIVPKLKSDLAADVLRGRSMQVWAHLDYLSSMQQVEVGNGERPVKSTGIKKLPVLSASQTTYNGDTAILYSTKSSSADDPASNSGGSTDGTILVPFGLAPPSVLGAMETAEVSIRAQASLQTSMVISIFDETGSQLIARGRLRLGGLCSEIPRLLKDRDVSVSLTPQHDLISGVSGYLIVQVNFYPADTFAGRLPGEGEDPARHAIEGPGDVLMQWRTEADAAPQTVTLGVKSIFKGPILLISVQECMEGVSSRSSIGGDVMRGPLLATPVGKRMVALLSDMNAARFRSAGQATGAFAPWQNAEDEEVAVEDEHANLASKARMKNDSHAAALRGDVKGEKKSTAAAKLAQNIDDPFGDSSINTLRNKGASLLSLPPMRTTLDSLLSTCGLSLVTLAAVEASIYDDTPALLMLANRPAVSIASSYACGTILPDHDASPYFDPIISAYFQRLAAKASTSSAARGGSSVGAMVGCPSVFPPTLDYQLEYSWRLDRALLGWERPVVKGGLRGGETVETGVSKQKKLKFDEDRPTNDMRTPSQQVSLETWLLRSLQPSVVLAEFSAAAENASVEVVKKLLDSSFDAYVDAFGLPPLVDAEDFVQKKLKNSANLTKKDDEGEEDAISAMYGNLETMKMDDGPVKGDIMARLKRANIKAQRKAEVSTIGVIVGPEPIGVTSSTLKSNESSMKKAASNHQEIDSNTNGNIKKTTGKSSISSKPPSCHISLLPTDHPFSTLRLFADDKTFIVAPIIPKLPTSKKKSNGDGDEKLKKNNNINNEENQIDEADEKPEFIFGPPLLVHLALGDSLISVETATRAYRREARVHAALNEAIINLKAKQGVNFQQSSDLGGFVMHPRDPSAKSVKKIVSGSLSSIGVSLCAFVVNRGFGCFVRPLPWRSPMILQWPCPMGDALEEDIAEIEKLLNLTNLQTPIKSSTIVGQRRDIWGAEGTCLIRMDPDPTSPYLFHRVHTIYPEDWAPTSTIAHVRTLRPAALQFARTFEQPQIVSPEAGGFEAPNSATHSAGGFSSQLVNYLTGGKEAVSPLDSSCFPPCKSSMITSAGLRTHAASRFLKWLESVPPFCPVDSETLTDMLHARGLNCSMLGVLANETRSAWVRALLVTEVIARSAKGILRQTLRHFVLIKMGAARPENTEMTLLGVLDNKPTSKRASLVASWLTGGLLCERDRKVATMGVRLLSPAEISVINLFNLVLGYSTESDIFWEEPLTKWAELRFGLKPRLARRTECPMPALALALSFHIGAEVRLSSSSSSEGELCLFNDVASQAKFAARLATPFPFRPTDFIQWRVSTKPSSSMLPPGVPLREWLLQPSAIPLLDPSASAVSHAPPAPQFAEEINPPPAAFPLPSVLQNVTVAEELYQRRLDSSVFVNPHVLLLRPVMVRPASLASTSTRPYLSSLHPNHARREEWARQGPSPESLPDVTVPPLAGQFASTPNPASNYPTIPPTVSQVYVSHGISLFLAALSSRPAVSLRSPSPSTLPAVFAPLAIQGGAAWGVRALLEPSEALANVFSPAVTSGVSSRPHYWTSQLPEELLRFAVLAQTVGRPSVAKTFAESATRWARVWQPGIFLKINLSLMWIASSLDDEEIDLEILAERSAFPPRKPTNYDPQAVAERLKTLETIRKPLYLRPAVAALAEALGVPLVALRSSGGAKNKGGGAIAPVEDAGSKASHKGKRGQLTAGGISNIRGEASLPAELPIAVQSAFTSLLKTIRFLWGLSGHPFEADVIVSAAACFYERGSWAATIDLLGRALAVVIDLSPPTIKHTSEAIQNFMQEPPPLSRMPRIPRVSSLLHQLGTSKLGQVVNGISQSVAFMLYLTKSSSATSSMQLPSSLMDGWGVGSASDQAQLGIMGGGTQADVIHALIESLVFLEECREITFVSVGDATPASKAADVAMDIVHASVLLGDLLARRGARIRRIELLAGARLSKFAKPNPSTDPILSATLMGKAPPSSAFNLQQDPSQWHHLKDSKVPRNRFDVTLAMFEAEEDDIDRNERLVSSSKNIKNSNSQGDKTLIHDISPLEFDDFNDQNNSISETTKRLYSRPSEWSDVERDTHAALHAFSPDPLPPWVASLEGSFGTPEETDRLVAMLLARATSFANWAFLARLRVFGASHPLTLQSACACARIAEFTAGETLGPDIARANVFWRFVRREMDLSAAFMRPGRTSGDFVTLQDQAKTTEVGEITSILKTKFSGMIASMKSQNGGDNINNTHKDEQLVPNISQEVLFDGDDDETAFSVGPFANFLTRGDFSETTLALHLNPPKGVIGREPSALMAASAFDLLHDPRVPSSEFELLRFDLTRLRHINSGMMEWGGSVTFANALKALGEDGRGLETLFLAIIKEAQALDQRKLKILHQESGIPQSDLETINERRVRLRIAMRTMQCIGRTICLTTIPARSLIDKRVQELEELTAGNVAPKDFYLGKVGVIPKGNINASAAAFFS